MMHNAWIQLVPADVSLAEQAADYYQRNRSFLQKYDPLRSEEFYSPAYQEEVLKREVLACGERTAFRFYMKPADQPQRIIGTIGLNNVIWGAFCSAFLGYRLDEKWVNRGYMSQAVAMVVKYAFEELHLHRIEANVMPWNKSSLRVLEKNNFIMEGISKYYLHINGVWEDHVHMVKINYDMH